MTQFSKAELKTAWKTMRKNIKKGKGYKKLKIKDTKGKVHTLTRRQYFGLLQQYNLYRYNHGRYPYKVTYNGKAKDPIVINYQDNKFQCCCASFNMCLQGFGKWIDEGDIAKAFHTTTNGTSPDNMIAGAKKLGYEVKRIGRNRKSVEEAKKKGYGVIAHIDTIKAPSLGYLHNYGHYVCISRVTKPGNYRVYDPTKGVHSIKPSELDNAMLNRTIYYYSVKPL